jgi:two-component system, NtrC family, sensor kinase
MKRLLQVFARSIGFAHDPEVPAGSAERPLRVLLVASILLPVLLFAAVSVISYRQHFVDARDRLQRDLGRVTEHALKVFETFELSAAYLDEMLSNVTDEEIRQSEREYSTRLHNIAATLPQLRDLWVIDADGYPVVSGTVFPMPRVDLSDREYFRVHKNNEVQGIHISEVLTARAADTKFFAVSRRRETDGKFEGVTIVSIAPEYFTEYYSRLPRGWGSASALLRSDGTVLARFPEPPGAPIKLGENSPFIQASRLNPERGMFTSIAAYDGVERTFAYRKLPRHDAYVMSSFADSAVVQYWLRDMGSHLIFGIPATLAMIGLGFTALRRTQRLQDEVARRQATEMALRQSQKMEAVGRLSGGIAHDFNNMLTIILGNIDMAMRRLDEPGSADKASRITRMLSAARQASERAATLVQRLLAFSRQHPQEVKAVDINRLVQGMSELLRRTIGETIVTETVLAGGIWKVAVDPNQLENAILNLAVNARDAMQDGGRLTIETSNSYLDENYVAAHASEIQPGQYVMLAITDSGTGMTRDVIERAFEPFFTTKPTGMGTGLGLSMVYGFAKQSGGHIKIYSEIREGTTIKLYFPRIAEQRDIPLWTGDERVAGPRALAGGGNETILLVEDEEEVQRFAAELLRERGYKVHATADGQSALRMLEGDPDVRLLFTDVVLPGGMNGRQLAEQAQRMRPDLKVLYATGYTRNAIIHQGRLDPDVDLLTKPFTADALTRKVRVILDAKPNAEPAAAEARS